tara:strand:+ start:1057 stop:1365 length:309 start_codon:yes stop_codon:yes gene_type:complete
MELGIVGGNNVSQVKGNLVDLENDLRGQTRLNTRCPAKKNTWQDNNNKINVPGELCKKDLNIDTDKVHLPPCQMIRYEPVPLPPALDFPNCTHPSHKMQFGK